MIVTILMILLIAVVISLVWFFVWKAKTIKRLRDIRDDFDLTTPEGKFLINAYNEKINQLNGYKVWK